MSDVDQARFRHALKATKTLKWLGKVGEAAACRYLEQLGWIILERNVRCGRTPESDIIARAPCGTTVFIEVKTRTISDRDRYWHESACQTITAEKQRRMLLAARMYMRESSLTCRFDLILVGLTYSTAKLFLEEDDQMCDSMGDDGERWFDTSENSPLPRRVDDLINRLVTAISPQNEQIHGLRIIHCAESIVTRT